MATDSTELTFVRCPSCRSLVPAVSSRCRMCGAGLDSNDDISADEMVDAVSDTPPAAAPVEAPVAAPVAAADEGVDLDDDPLGDYLQEHDDDDADEAEASSGESDDAGDDPLADEAPAAMNGAVDPMGDPDSPPLYMEEGHHVDPAGVDPISAPAEMTPADIGIEDEPAPVDIPEAPVEPQSSPKRMTVERGRKKRGLSFRKEKKEDAPSSATARKKSVARKRPMNEAEEYGDYEERPRKTKKVSSRRTRERQVEPEPMPESDLENELRHAPTPSYEKNESREGRLFGWMVSFDNPDGDAIELREGKFFVSATPLKENDLVLDKASISTPHALVAATTERGLLVQDLMSERGVFVRGHDDNAYHREEETIRLEHGDWVRFGDQEFLITLVPRPGRG